MPLYTVALTVTIEASSPVEAARQAVAANKSLNEPLTKSLIATQGLQVKSIKVGTPVPVAV